MACGNLLAELSTRLLLASRLAHARQYVGAIMFQALQFASAFLVTTVCAKNKHFCYNRGISGLKNLR